MIRVTGATPGSKVFVAWPSANFELQTLSTDDGVVDAREWRGAVTLKVSAGAPNVQSLLRTYPSNASGVHAAAYGGVVLDVRRLSSPAPPVPPVLPVEDGERWWAAVHEANGVVFAGRPLHALGNQLKIRPLPYASCADTWRTHVRLAASREDALQRVFVAELVLAIARFYSAGRDTEAPVDTGVEAVAWVPRDHALGALLLPALPEVRRGRVTVTPLLPALYAEVVRPWRRMREAPPDGGGEKSANCLLPLTDDEQRKERTEAENAEVVARHPLGSDDMVQALPLCMRLALRSTHLKFHARSHVIPALYTLGYSVAEITAFARTQWGGGAVVTDVRNFARRHAHGDPAGVRCAAWVTRQADVPPGDTSGCPFVRHRHNPAGLRAELAGDIEELGMVVGIATGTPPPHHFDPMPEGDRQHTRACASELFARYPQARIDPCHPFTSSVRRYRNLAYLAQLEAAQGEGV